jgi:hypothetical protein
VGPSAQLQAHLAAHGLQALASQPREGGALQVLARGQHPLVVPAGLAMAPVTLEDLFGELTR